MYTSAIYTTQIRTTYTHNVCQDEVGVGELSKAQDVPMETDRPARKTYVWDQLLVPIHFYLMSKPNRVKHNLMAASAQLSNIFDCVGVNKVLRLPHSGGCRTMGGVLSTSSLCGH